MRKINVCKYEYMYLTTETVVKLAQCLYGWFVTGFCLFECF